MRRALAIALVIAVSLLFAMPAAAKLTNFPNGVASFGVPLMGSGPSIPATTGNYFFVDSGASGTSNGNLCTSPSEPCATIDGAVGKCTASNGDVIIVMPGHAENISAATSLVVDVAGVSIIGLGNGSNRPVLSFTATAGSIEMDAANTRLSNVVLRAAIASVVVAVNVDADNVEIDNCEFTISATGIEFLLMVDIDAKDYAYIHHNRFLAENIAGTNTGIRLDDTVGTRIVANEFRGDFTTGAISGTAGTAAASVDVAVLYNVIENLDATAGVLLDHHDDTTGITAHNSGFTLYATDITAPFDPGNTLNVENYVVNAVDETGAVSPTTGST